MTDCTHAGGSARHGFLASHLQNHLYHAFGYADEGEQNSMTIRQSLAARKHEERKLRRREAAAQLAEVPTTTEVVR